MKHEMMWGKKSIADLINKIDSLGSGLVQLKCLHDMSSITINCIKCGKEWILTDGTVYSKKIITEQFRIYIDGHTKKYKTTTNKQSSLGVLRTKDTWWAFVPKSYE